MSSYGRWCVMGLAVALTIGTAVVRTRRDGGDEHWYRDRAIQVVSAVKDGDDWVMQPYLDTAMRAAFTKVPSKQCWNQICARYGPLLALGSPTKRLDGAVTVVTVPCQLTFAQVDFKVFFNEAKQVCGFFYVKRRENQGCLPAAKRGQMEMSRARYVVNALAVADSAGLSKLLDSDMSSLFGSQAQAQFWHALEYSWGPYRQIGRVTRLSSQDADAVRVSCQFANGSTNIVVNFNIGGQITGIYRQDVAHAPR